MEEIVLVDEMSYRYFQALLESIQSLCDEDLQERVWAGGDYSLYTSFDEVYMHFADLAEDILTWDLPADKISLISALYDRVDHYHQKRKPDKEVAHDPKWHEIRTFGKKVYDRLKCVKYVLVLCQLNFCGLG